ncbi:BspC domain-containing protein [Burkholderia anthina]|uniref:BspC domain-containing protein n=1 Tax=Burkholderia anthina TaxID=179879 RepID=UPI0037C1839A
MKGPLIFLATLMLLLAYAARSSADDAIPDDYRYLARINVRPVVIHCVAEIDRWIRTSAKYDMFLAPDVRLLRAKVRAFRGMEDRSGGGPLVDSMVTVRASARLRPRGAWLPVTAKCGIWRTHVVSVMLKPSDLR